MGVQKFVYDIFKPGINLASRMEERSEPMQITRGQRSYAPRKGDFACSERGGFDIKGFGTQRPYFLDSENA